ncbi:MAG: hypothetical protein ACR2PL_08020, partial [Dehalococcoidia bacterium]
NQIDEATREQQAEQSQRTHERFNAFGMAPATVADVVFEAIREEKFYILTHPNIKQRVRSRLEDILEERNPSPAPAAMAQSAPPTQSRTE